MTSTTIKVPRALRDALAVRAAEQGTTLAGAIQRALEESDEQRFWAAVTAEHAALAEEERAAYVRSTEMDDLADDSDDAITARGEW